MAVSESILSTLTLDFHAVLLAMPSDDSVQPPTALLIKLEQTCRALSYFVDHTSVDVIYRLQSLVMQVFLTSPLH